MARVLKPPAALDLTDGDRVVFLAGSIGTGRAGDWQAEVVQALAGEDAVILNPRRDEWDATWEQSIHDPNFRGQVEWELDGQERSTVIAMYFDPATRAPITLLELGLFARTGKVVVGCPAGFWRRGNVEVVCERFGIPVADDLTSLVELARRRLSGDRDAV